MLLILSVFAGSPDMATLPQILNFITGCSACPPLGFKLPIQIKFLSANTAASSFPEVEACFNTIRLPVMKKKEEFFEKMDKAVLYSFGYFGRV